MTADLSQDDRGKTLVAGSERVGVITDVSGDSAAVDPDWENVDDDLAATLGWDDEDGDYEVQASDITAVRNGQARLRDDLA